MHISGVESLNEHTDTRMVTDKALLRNHLLAEQAAVDVWNSTYRGRVVHSSDGGEGLIPADCRLVIVNGPVGNDIPKEFFTLAIESDSWLGYHNYSFYPGGARPPDEWQFHSGRWQVNEQDYGLRPAWAFTEGGPYLDTGRGWRSPDVFNADIHRLTDSLGILARETSATEAAQQGRVVGPTALFTCGPWEWYRYTGEDLEACAVVFKNDWKPGSAPMNNAIVKQHAQAIIYHADDVWWLRQPPPFKAAAPNKVVTFRHADGTVITPNPRPTPITYQLDVFETNDMLALLRVTDWKDKPNWWAFAADLSPA